MIISPLDNLTSTVQALIDSGAVSAGGQIEVGSYVGTGTYGSNNPNSLTFDFEPKFVVVTPEGTKNADSPFLAPPLFAIRNGNAVRPTPRQYAGSGSINAWLVLPAIWDGNTVSWYTTASYSSTTQDKTQLNGSDETYYYMAIG